MKIEGVNFSITDWGTLITEENQGKSGKSFSKRIEQGNIRVRLVEYSQDFIADHWCKRGHIAYVLEGELIIELCSGKSFRLKPGMSFQVAENNDDHLIRTGTGARVLIID